MFPFFTALTPFGLKVLGGLALITLIVFGLNARSCSKKRAGRALIKHNTEKLEREVSESQRKASNFSEVQKLKKSLPAKYKGQKLYYHKDCPAKNKEDCIVTLPKLTPEEAKKKRNEHLKKLKRDLAL